MIKLGPLSPSASLVQAPSACSPFSNILDPPYRLNVDRMVCPYCDQGFHPDTYSWDQIRVDTRRVFILCPNCSKKTVFDLQSPYQLNPDEAFSAKPLVPQSSIQAVRNDLVSLAGRLNSLESELADIKSIKIRHFETNDVYEVHKRIERLEIRQRTLESRRPDEKGYILMWGWAGLAVLNLILLFLIFYQGILP